MNANTKHALEVMMPEDIFAKEYDLHRRRLEGVESMVDDRTPHHYVHLDTRLKAAELRERRQTEIEMENKVLLKRMTKVLLGREDKFHLHHRHKIQKHRMRSLNIEYRQREQAAITKENYNIAKRIEKVQPIYSRGAWEAEWDYRQKVLRQLEMKKYKVYNPLCSPRRLARKSGYGSDESSEESEGHKKSKKKERLPPIKSATATTGRGRSQQKSGKGRGYHSARSPRPLPGEATHEYRSPDPELWMYYGVPPGDSSDEEDFYYKRSKDEEKSTKRKKPAKDEQKTKKSPEKQIELDAKLLYQVASRAARPHDIIIKTLALRSFKQRMKLKDKYEELYHTDLKEDLKKGLSADWSLLLETLLTEEKSDQHKTIGRMIKGGDAPALVRRLTPLTNSELAALKEEYLKENSESLESAISAKFDGPTERFFLTLVKGAKRESQHFRDKAVEREAKALLEQGEGRWTSESGKLMLLLEQRTPGQMNRVFQHYKQLNKGRSAVKAVQEECPKDYAEALTAYINCTDTAWSDAVDRLHRNLDPTNPVFVRTVVARSETDLARLRKDYKRKYLNELSHDLEQKSDHTTVCVLKAVINKEPPKPKAASGKPQEKHDGKRSRSSSTSSTKEERWEEEERNWQEAIRRLEEQEELYKKKEGAVRHGSPRHHLDEPSPRHHSHRAEEHREHKEHKEHKPKSSPRREEHKDEHKAKTSPHKDEKKAGKKENKKDPDEEAARRHKDKDDGGADKTKEGKKEEKEEEKEEEKDEDAVRLFNALKGIGTDEDTIIDVLTKNSNAERQTLKQRYQQLYKEDLPSDLESELSGDFQKVALALMLPPAQYDADYLNTAMDRLGTDEGALIGVICCRSPTQLDQVKKAYKDAHNKDLESEVKSETSGDFRELLLHLLSASKGDNVDKDRADKDAMALKDFPTHYEVKALFLENSAQIAATAKAYEEFYGEDISWPIKKATSGDAEKAYLATLRSQDDPVEFFANQLNGAMRGLGTDESTLTHIIISRSEIDLAAIKGQYQQLFGKSLRADVEKETSGDYRKILLKLLDKVGEQTPKKKDDKKVTRRTPPSETETQGSKGKTKEEPNKDKGSKSELKNENESQAKQDEGKENKAVKLEEIDENDEDATKLYKAMNGLGTKEDVVIEVITRNSNADRQAVKERYQELYKQDLASDLESELSGDFQTLVLALMRPPVEYDTVSLHSAMDRLGTDEDTLLGVICSRSPAQLDQIKKAYKQEYESDLASDVEKETSGGLKDLLLQLLSAGKAPKGEKADRKRADVDAQLLHETPSDELVKRIFIKSSPVQILSTASAHKYYYGEDISESIKKASCGDEEKAYLAYVRALQDQATFYAERLRSAMTGLGTKEAQLTRILVSRSEVDLPVIKGRYQRLYGRPLRADVEKETSGDYRKTLLAVLDKVGEVKDESGQGASRSQSATSRGPEEDAIKIYKAMHRIGTDEEVVVDIVCKLSNAQRQQLKRRYFELYKQDLEKDLRTELSGDFEDTVMSLLVPADEFEARCLHEAMEGAGTDETTLVGIVCSKSPAELERLKETYKRAYKRDLEMDIVKETSGDFRELLLALAMGKRDTTTIVHKDIAEEDAKTIHEAPTPDTLRRILVDNSTAQVHATMKEYTELYNEDITESIKKATSGDLREGYVAVVQALRDQTTFFAERAHAAMKGVGTNEKQLTRIIVSRSEVDLPAIKTTYNALYGRSLVKHVRSETSGDYRRMLVRLLHHWGGAELPEDRDGEGDKA